MKWGGIALAVVFAIAVIYVETIAPIPEGGEISAPVALNWVLSAPVALYWALLVVGAVAAIAGFVLDRRKGSSTS